MLLAAVWRQPASSITASHGSVKVRVCQKLWAWALPNSKPRSPGWSRNYSVQQAAKVVHEAHTTEPEQAEATSKSNAIIVAQQDPTSNTESESSQDSSPTLSAEQEAVVSRVVKGGNFCIAGPAGSGKSTVLRAIRDRLRSMGKVVDVLAPTGKVAIANGGMTFWTFAGWTPNSFKMGLHRLANSWRSAPLFERLKEVDTIIMDEISMVENFNFGRLDQLMRAARSIDDKPSPLPFGGVQIITTGDFCQLPPVKPFQHCFRCGTNMKHDKRLKTYSCPNDKCNEIYHESEQWAYKSPAWEACDFKYVHLNAIYRQNDPEFIALLEKLRLGLPLNDADIALLTRPRHSIGSDALRLYPTRDKVRRLNDFEFGRLKATEQVYRCVDIFLWNEEEHPELEDWNERLGDGSLRALKDHRLEVQVRLKEGMKVILQHNLNLSSGLCNGAQGKIVGFESFESWLPPFSIHNEKLSVYLPHHGIAEDVFKQFKEQCKNTDGWPIVEFQNGVTRTIYPVCQPALLGNTDPYSLLGRIQIPLAAAWALTIHKSQGMTLDKYIVDIDGLFEKGQLYVALSRARTLDGVKVEGDLAALQKFGGNLEVLEWLEEKFGHGK